MERDVREALEKFATAMYQRGIHDGLKHGPIVLRWDIPPRLITDLMKDAGIAALTVSPPAGGEVAWPDEMKARLAEALRCHAGSPHHDDTAEAIVAALEPFIVLRAALPLSAVLDSSVSPRPPAP